MGGTGWSQPITRINNHPNTRNNNNNHNHSSNSHSNSRSSFNSITSFNKYLLQPMTLDHPKRNQRKRRKTKTRPLKSSAPTLLEAKLLSSRRRTRTGPMPSAGNVQDAAHARAA